MDVPRAARVARPSWANMRTLIGLLLFCTAVVAGRNLLDDARGTSQVWVAAHDIPQDAALVPDDLRVIDVRLPDDVDGYVPASRDVTGAVLTRPLLEGEMLNAAWVATGDEVTAGRTLTIPIEPEHAVGGDLHPGDRVDVVATFNAGDVRAHTVPLLRAVEIRDLVTAGGLVVGEEAVVGVTVGVTPQEAVDLIFAVRNAEIDVVRVDGDATDGDTTPVDARDIP